MDSGQDRKPLFKARTRANIEPGYDIAAIALNIYNKCSVFKGRGKKYFQLSG